MEYFKAQAGEIIARLKPITLHMVSRELGSRTLAKGNYRVHHHAHAVGVYVNDSEELYVEGTLAFCQIWSDFIRDSPTVLFTPFEERYVGCRKAETEPLECVYDTLGRVISEDECEVKTCHALMMPPKDGQLGRCFALLEVTKYFESGIKVQRIVSPAKYPHLFWGNYANTYPRDELSIDFVPERKYNHQKGAYCHAAYIGDVPVAGAYRDQDKVLIISYEEFDKL